MNDFPPLRARETVVGRGLPIQLTSFVGREAELADLERLVGDHRLVTLTGAGGVGKTRLALQLGADLVDRFADGVWCVDLAPITDPELVVIQVARTLGLRDQPGRSTLESLIRLVDDRRLLMVLDNCEHLLDACALLLTALLGACAGLRVVATSREPLGVPGELTWLTPSLSQAGEAAELFTQRAVLARPDFKVTGENAASIDEICRRLDGVPLAIELAAARVRGLSLADILDGLADRFRLLTGGVRTALPRQQTLHASVDWSYALLSEPERVLFRRLAVFLGGFDVDAAHTVAGGDAGQRYQTVDDLALLVGKSLVVADKTLSTTRYRMLETVRQYALDTLRQSGESDMMRTRHRDHYTALFDTPAATGHRQRIELAEVEIDNLRAAFAWSRDCGDIDRALQLASSLQPLWLQGRITEGLAWFDAALLDDPAVAPVARACALADKVMLDAFTGVFGQVDQAGSALRIARELGDPALLARVLAACGATCAFHSEVALPYFREAIELARASGDDWRLSQVLGWLGLSVNVAGDPAAARAASEEGRDLADAIGDGFMSRMCRWNIGLAHWMTADLATAVAQFREVEAEARVAHDPVWRAYGLFSVGKTRAYLGDPTGARAAAEAALEVAVDITGFQRALSLGALVDALLAAGDVAAAVTTSATAWETCPQPSLLAANVYPIAQVELARGEVGTARRWADEAVSAASGVHRMILLATRVRVAIAERQVELAERDAHDALAIAADAKAYLMIPDVLECLAGLTADSGSHPRAARLFGSAQAIRDRTGQVRFRIYDDAYDAALNALRAAMTRKEFEAGWADGAVRTPDEGIAYAMRGRGARNRPAVGWASLTRAERNVVQLLGDGLTNREIAARLRISPRTVQTHLTHVYAKLEVSSRAQLVREAARHG